MRKAYINYSGCCALIIDLDTTYKLEHDQSAPIDVTGIHEDMYLQRGINVITEEEPEPFPYEGLHARLKEEHWKDETLLYVLLSFDPTYSKELRKEIFEEAEKTLADNNAYEYVLNCVRKVPLPQEWTLEGIPGESKLGEIAQAIREKWAA